MYIFNDNLELEFVHIENDIDMIPAGYHIHLVSRKKVVFKRKGCYDFIYFPEVNDLDRLICFLSKKLDQSFLEAEYNRITGASFFNRIRRKCLNNFKFIRWIPILKQWL